MYAVESPIESLAIGYLSKGLLTAVNNIWAWVAVILAAVGFWRIRGLSLPLRRSIEVDPSKLPSFSGKMAEASATVSASVETKHWLPVSPSTTSNCVLESGGSPKGKFSVYYKDDFEECHDRSEDETDGGKAAVEREKLGWGCGEWGRTMVVRMGDMGWYRCQDLMVLDGSVVRLWDGRRRRTASTALVADGGLTW